MSALGENGAPRFLLCAGLCGVLSWGPGPAGAQTRVGGPARVEDAGRLAERAREAFLEESFSRATAEARRALAANPDDALANAVLGSAQAVLALQGRVFGNVLFRDLREEGPDVAEARRLVERALELQPRLALAHNGLGLALVGEGRLAEAQAAFERALALVPSLAAARCNLGFVHWQSGRLVEAEEAYRQAIGLDPASAVARNGLANVMASQGRYAEAAAACREAIARYRFRDRVLATFYVNLGVTLHGQGRNKAAREAVAMAKSLGLQEHPAYPAIAGGGTVDPPARRP